MKISELIKQLADILSDCGDINIYAESEGKLNSVYTAWTKVEDRIRKHEIVWK